MSQKARLRSKWAAFTSVALEYWDCTLRMGFLLLVEAVCTLGPPLLLAARQVGARGRGDPPTGRSPAQPLNFRSSAWTSLVRRYGSC
jgi:hypothetical protein